MLKRGSLSIQLPRIPDLPELHQMLSQALEQRGQIVSATWRVPGRMVQFSLELVCQQRGGDPQWTLVFEHATKREQVFQYGSVDVLLVYNLLLSSCSDILGQTQSLNKPAQTSTRLNQAAEPMPNSLQVQAPLPARAAASFMKSTEVARRDVTSTTSGAISSVQLVPSSGEISAQSLPALMQTILIANATGRLDVRSSDAAIVVFFKNGVPVDATAADTVGDDALIELLTWTKGRFTFESRVLRHSQTVHHTVEALLAQSKRYSEQLRQLEEFGMQASSTFSPLESIDEMTFVQKLSRGTPTDMGTLGRFFRSLNGKQNLDELCRTMGHSRILAVQLLHHLISNGAVKIVNQPGRGQKASLLAVLPRRIDGAAIQAVMMSLRRMDTGMFLYPAFLYFLEQEYFRTYRSRSALSIVVFELRYVPPGGNPIKAQVLPGPAALDAVLRISQLKRHQDLLAHYDAYDYALLLPNTKSQGAQTFANRVIKVLTSSPLAGGIDGSQLRLALGCACIPEDCTDLSLLLGAADLAMSQARQTKEPLVMFRDIRQLSTLKP